jgi:hypothetical protein
MACQEVLTLASQHAVTVKWQEMSSVNRLVSKAAPLLVRYSLVGPAEAEIHTALQPIARRYVETAVTITVQGILISVTMEI